MQLVHHVIERNEREKLTCRSSARRCFFAGADSWSDEDSGSDAGDREEDEEKVVYRGVLERRKDVKPGMFI
jgi:hypothetical protein